MYPYIVLRFRNNIPKIFLVSLENQEREITISEDLNMLDIVLQLGEKFNLLQPNLSREEQYSYLINLARESDETFASSYGELEDIEDQFQLKKYIQQFLEDNRVEPLYLDIEMDKDVRDQLDRNQNSDVFASTLDYIYTILIAKTVLVASDLGIGVIHLDDETKNTRLQEKMALELEKIDVEFIVD